MFPCLTVVYPKLLHLQKLQEHEGKYVVLFFCRCIFLLSLHCIHMTRGLVSVSEMLSGSLDGLSNSARWCHDDDAVCSHSIAKTSAEESEVSGSEQDFFLRARRGLQEGRAAPVEGNWLIVARCAVSLETGRKRAGNHDTCKSRNLNHEIEG